MTNKNIIIFFLFLIFSSCITPECFRGIYSTKKLIELDNESANKIISNDTLYVNEHIVLTKSVFRCSENRTRTMKVLRNLKDSKMILVPYESDYRNDSILYVNTQFFISPLDSGLIVSSQVNWNETHYDYPKDEHLDLLIKNLDKIGIYRLENGEFTFQTESMSKDSFKQYCKNETCFIPYPGILYDKKVNLNNLESINQL